MIERGPANCWGTQIDRDTARNRRVSGPEAVPVPGERAPDRSVLLSVDDGDAGEIDDILHLIAPL